MFRLAPKNLVVEAVPETKRLVVVAFVVVAFMLVKFCKVVEPRTVREPVESTRKTEVVAFEPSLASAEISGMVEFVDEADTDSLASGVVVPIPMRPAAAGTDDTVAPLYIPVP